MSALVILQYDAPDDRGGHRHVLSVFVRRQRLNADQLDSAVAPHLTRGSLFDEVHFVGADDTITVVSTFLDQDCALRQRLDAVGLLPKVCLITFDSATRRVHGYRSNKTEVPPSTIESERQHFLAGIFRTSGGLVTAPRGIHYVKPSGAHSNAFLRSANVVEDGAHAEALGFWLLPYFVTAGINRIFVDTSGIAAAAMAAAYEAFRMNLTFEVPLVDSHRSYEGLDAIGLEDPEGALFVISASTSGNLRQKIIDRGAHHERVVTLFFLGDDASRAGAMLCDLTKRDSFPGGFETIRNAEGSNCTECANHSYPVKLSGDQFSVEPCPIREVDIRLNDLPQQERRVIERYAGIGLFKVFRNTPDRHFELFLDVSALFGNPDNGAHVATQQAVSRFGKSWALLVNRGLPIHTRRIVHASYPFSRELAESAKAHAVAKILALANIAVLKSAELRAQPTDPGTASLVVTACMDDAHELTGVSRDLRTVQPDGNITYITPILRASSAISRRRLTGNLTFGDRGVNTYNLYCLEELQLPLCRQFHSWDRELSDLYEIRDWTLGIDEELPGELEKRIKLLQEAPSRGLLDDLFWPGHLGARLSIRPDFVFLDTQGGTKPILQADIYFVMTSLLHHLRTHPDAHGKLFFTSYEQTVLSPENFHRLSDGVIQAALLRAAEPRELCYLSTERGTSGRMAIELLQQIDRYREGGGEAITEFLIALLASRMTLLKPDLQAVCEACYSSEALPSHARHIARFILQKTVRGA